MNALRELEQAYQQRLQAWPRGRAVPAGLPIAGYAVWYHSAYGTYGFSGFQGAFQYGRVAPTVRCETCANAAVSVSSAVQMFGSDIQSIDMVPVSPFPCID